MKYVFVAARNVTFSEDDENMIKELSLNARPKVKEWIDAVFRVYLQESYQEVQLINKTTEEYSIRNYDEDLWNEMIKWLNAQDKIQDISKLTVDDVVSGLESTKPFKDDKIEIIKRYKNGHYWVDLQGTRSRTRDAKILKFPLTSFNALVSKSKIYSLRDIQEKPIALVLIQDKELLNIVYRDVAVVQYLPFIQDFIDLKLYESINLVNLLKVNLTVYNGVCYNVTDLPRKLILTLPSVKFEPNDKVYIPNSATFDALDLANCKLDTLPDNVTVKGILDISNSTLKTLPTNLFVTTLYMKKCLIKNLSGIFVTEQIDASDSKLSILPNNLTLSGCLNISNTDVDKLPLNLNVYRLIASNTNIKFIPSTLKVKKLDISNSLVTKLPNNLVLEELNISGCNILELPENLTVNTLIMLDTPITSIPESCKITNLKHNVDELEVPKSIKVLE